MGVALVAAQASTGDQPAKVAIALTIAGQRDIRGSLIVLGAAGVSINMMSLFAFIVALGLVVDDLDETRARLLAAGASVHFEPDYEPGRRLYFLDPDGHEVEVVAYS